MKRPFRNLAAWVRWGSAQDHRDLCKANWSAGTRELIERIDVFDEKARLDSDYIYVSEPHAYDECPFRDNDQVRFV